MPEYLPTLRLFFDGGGVFNDYRLNGGTVEFHNGNGEWRILDESDLQLHYVLHTEVSRWLQQQSINANPHVPR
jgi:hypothetical protein